jgi:Uma2 family endonuclease
MATVAQPAEKLMTLAEFLQLPDDGISRELVKGRVVEMPQAKPRHGYVCAEIGARLREHVKAHELGRVVGESGIITERDPDSMRGPDVSFYSYERIPRGPMPDGYLDALPELIVEVLSTFDRWPRVLEKIVEYLDSGVKVVCVIDPDTQTVQVHTAQTAVRHLTRDDTLEIAEVLPGFRCRVGDLFL